MTPDVRRLMLQVTSLYDVINGTGGIIATIDSQGRSIYSLLASRSSTPAAPVANMLWNGEIGHSVHTWNDTATSVFLANSNEEAAWWYSHQTPASATTFIGTAVNTGNGNLTLPAHGYSTALQVNLLADTSGGTGGVLPTGWSGFATQAFVIVIDPNTIRLATTMANAFAGTAVVPSNDGTDGTEPFGIEPLLDDLYTNNTDGAASYNNQELKTTDHTTYYPQFSRWNSSNGWGELTGTTTIDQPLPMNFIDATVALSRVSLIAAKRNAFIEIPDTCLMCAGIFDNTSGQRKFIQGSIGVTATYNGTPTPGGTQRKYAILLTSDRGYTLLSPEVTVENTPASLDSTHNITLSWGQQAGQLQVDIYEYVGAQYYLIAQVSAATSYIHEGSYIATAPDGYPAATGTVRDGTYVTQTLDMADLATNGVSSAWDTTNFPIEVPDNYNKSVTTDRQWLRIWMTQAANLFITDVVTDGTAVITIPDGAVNSDTYANGGYCSSLPGSNPFTALSSGNETLYFGLVVQVYDVDDALLATTSIAEIGSNTSITLATTIATGTNRKVRIVGGGFHGVYVDKIHLGFQQNTSYAPNALDSRSLQPLASPTSSTQGGVGDGGTGGGIIRCVAEGTPIKMHAGVWKRVETTRPGQLWASAALKPNVLGKLIPGTELVRRVRTANGVQILCTDTEKFMPDALDPEGTRLASLREGDLVMTEVDGRQEASEIVEISSYIGRVMVYTPTLTGNRLFIAGEIVQTRWQKFWAAITRQRPKQGGFILHNKEETGGGGSV